jgi:glycosyltransferase involved in cell wall biosynthesis
MVCGTLLSRPLTSHNPASGEMFGATVAQNELIHASLALSSTIRWNFWTPGLQPSITEPAGSSRSASPDVALLQSRFGDRVMSRTLSRFPAVVRNRQDYLFVVGLPAMPRISDLRQQFHCERVPICALLHAACLPDLIWSYARVAMSSEDCDVLIATSLAGKNAIEKIMEAAAEHVAGRLGIQNLNFPRPRVLHLPLGVDLPPEEALDPEPARRIFQLPSHCFTILYLGRLSQEYKADLDVLLQAVARVSTTERDVRLILAGQVEDKAYSRHLQKRLARLGLTGRSLLFENFPDCLKSSLLAACDVFVSPVDSIQETFGLSVLEAMAHARPVVAPGWSGYRDLIVHGETGLLLKTLWAREPIAAAFSLAAFLQPYDLAHYAAQRTVIDVDELVSSLEQLLTNPDTALEMGRRGRQRVEDHFSWPRIAKQFRCVWTDQLERAKCVQRYLRPPIPPDQFFLHYADGVLSPDHFLVRAEGAADQPVDQWIFSDPTQAAQVNAMLVLCGRKPVRLAELRRAGYSSDCIVWLAKKGLCRIACAP